MAKVQFDKPPEQPAPIPAPIPEQPADVNPQLAFAAAWDKNADNMRAVLTRTGEVRGNLRPSEAKRAGEIRERYGV